MTIEGWFQIVAFGFMVLGLTPLVGRILVLVYADRATWLDRPFLPIERLIYRVTGVDQNHDMPWREYTVNLLVFSGVTAAALFALLRFQHLLPWNQMGLGPLSPDLAFNVAVSFMTNTNWQSYVPETTMSYGSQMAGLTVQNFVSAAAGMAVAVAVVRGLAAERAKGIGNVWVDLTRSWTRILLPFSFAGALVLVSQGVIQNLDPYATVPLVDVQADGTVTQTIAMGPVASQEIIKPLGTNGGGFFNANSAHPLENPTAVTNFFETLLIFVLPAGFVWYLGERVGSRRHGWAVWAAMALLFVFGVAVAYQAEAAGNPLLSNIPGVDTRQAGNLEGKETRFGLAASALFATVTTDASCGAVNTMHESMTPLGGFVPLVNMLLGEVIFGGVGAGLYGMVVFVVIAVFLAGLMVGRTPEYLGKPVQACHVQMAMIAVLVPPLTVLVLSAMSLAWPAARASLLNAGPHGLTEMLYAFASGAGNNGSAFAGLSANTRWLNLSIGGAMLVGRFAVIVPVLAMAGRFAAVPRVPPTSGTFPVTTPLFVVLLVSVIVVVGALTFFPALSLGPIVEHLVMHDGVTY